MSGTIALVVAAGRGLRAGGETPKQYWRLAGLPLLRHCLLRLVRHPEIDAVRVVIHPDDRHFYNEAATGLAVLDPVDGGKDRQESVRLGLESLAPLSPLSVLIHDAARPFPGAPMISRVLAALANHDGGIPSVPVNDTLKRWSDTEGRTATVPRENIFRAQTPQGFRFEKILEAHRKATGLSLTDDAAVAEAAGLDAVLVQGDEDNLKVTTPEDFQRAERLLEVFRETRCGQGFDVHRLVAGDGLKLCGVSIDCDLCLEGHSDADVGLHAAVDAILGAIAEGDIGTHFPPNDPKWKGMDSAIFVEEAARLLKQRRARILHLDLTLICERPKIGPHRQAMRERTAALLGIAPDRVSIKATTTERLGFTGRGEGIAVQALATVELPGD